MGVGTFMVDAAGAVAESRARVRYDVALADYTADRVLEGAAEVRTQVQELGETLREEARATREEARQASLTLLRQNRDHGLAMWIQTPLGEEYEATVADVGECRSLLDQVDAQWKALWHSEVESAGLSPVKVPGDKEYEGLPEGGGIFWGMGFLFSVVAVLAMGWNVLNWLAGHTFLADAPRPFLMTTSTGVCLGAVVIAVIMFAFARRHLSKWRLLERSARADFESTQEQARATNANLAARRRSTFGIDPLSRSETWARGNTVGAAVEAMDAFMDLEYTQVRRSNLDALRIRMDEIEARGDLGELTPDTVRRFVADLRS